MTYEFQGKKLTGIGKLRGALRGKPVALCCSGTTLADYDDARVPVGWARIAINEAIRKLGDRADYWVLSDDPIVLEYAALCPERTTVLAMHNATRIARRHLRRHTIYTVNSMPKVGNYDNPYEFFSRGTVLIGAIEMARYMGAERFFIFGLDCYSLRDRYYYDGRTPPALSEKKRDSVTRVRHGLPPDVHIYVTARLRNMIKRLGEVKAKGLWRGVEIRCVGSPHSQQQAIEKMSWEDFDKLVGSERELEPPSARRQRRRGRPKKKEAEHVPEDRRERVDPVLEEEGQVGQAQGAGAIPKPRGSEAPRAPDPALQEEGRVDDGEARTGQRPDQVVRPGGLQEDGGEAAKEEAGEESEEARQLAQEGG